MTPERLAEIAWLTERMGVKIEFDELIAYVRELEQLVDDVKLGRDRVMAERDELEADKARLTERVKDLEDDVDFYRGGE